jgi:hypothetical protein
MARADTGVKNTGQRPYTVVLIMPTVNELSLLRNNSLGGEELWEEDEGFAEES